MPAIEVIGARRNRIRLDVPLSYQVISPRQTNLRASLSGIVKEAPPTAGWALED
jgi:hypothetical protein